MKRQNYALERYRHGGSRQEHTGHALNEYWDVQDWGTKERAPSRGIHPARALQRPGASFGTSVRIIDALRAIQAALQGAAGGWEDDRDTDLCELCASEERLNAVRVWKRPWDRRLCVGLQEARGRG